MMHHERTYWQYQNQLIFPTFQTDETDETEILGETNIANEFNNFFTNIDLKLAKKIPESS